MSYKVHYYGGPNAGEISERLSAPTTIFAIGDGIYRLKNIKGRTAHYVWKEEEPMAKGEKSCAGFVGP